MLGYLKARGYEVLLIGFTVGSVGLFILGAYLNVSILYGLLYILVMVITALTIFTVQEIRADYKVYKEGK